MTDEIPRARDRPAGIVCDECNHDVRLSRAENGTLRATCGCDTRAVRVRAALPGGWLE